MSRIFAQVGVRLAVLDNPFEAAQKVVDEILQHGGQSILVFCRVFEQTSLELAAKMVLDALGPVDILVR
jgi:hypothetical protein